MRYGLLSLGDYYSNWKHRYFIYLSGAFLFGIWTFVAVGIYSEIYDKTAPGAFRGMYAWHTVLNFGLCHYLMDEWFSRLWPGKRTFRERTVDKTWLICFTAFLVAFLIQRTLVYDASALYYPKIISFYEKYPGSRPTAFNMFFFLFPFWTITVFILVQIALTGQRSLMHEKLRIDRLLEKKEKELASTYHTPRIAPSTSKTVLAIPFQNGIRNVSTDNISHVTIEDHYCRIYVNSNEESKNIFVKTSLKGLLKRLPADQFVQIHRSHVVNLDYISQMKKRNRSCELILKHGDHKLPVSRYRLPKIMSYLRAVVGDDD